MALNKKHYFIVATIMVPLLSTVIYLIYSSKASEIQKSEKPNIIIFIADDLGRNDVGFVGTNQIPTPNIDALAYNGIILDRFYTQCTCTPSRAALMTGNYPIRSGMQGYPLKAGENRSLPLDMATMPERLKQLGYKTHLVGKWHLGAAYRKNTPVFRGFDTHFGYWNGFLGYYQYTNYRKVSNGTRITGMDMHDQLEPVWSIRDHYVTNLFTEKSLEVIDKHNTQEPLLLVLSHLAPHTGFDGVELGVPNVTLINEKFSYIKDPRRRLYAGVVNSMDDSLGQIMKKLSDRNMLDNSIVLFFSDNGGQTIGMFDNTGSNWPLRGVKFAEFEGGIRTAAAIFSPLFRKRSYVSTELIHLSDWLPTFYASAGGDLKDLGKIDGINQWKSLSENVPSNRSEILVNINEVDHTSAIITDRGRYKLLQGTYENGLFDQYFGEIGQEPESPYTYKDVLGSVTNRVIEKVTKTPLTKEKISELTRQVDLSWCRDVNETPDIDCRGGCLFDLELDPCETTNIISSNGYIAKILYQKINDFRKELVPQTNKASDVASDPVLYNNTWCTWLDDELCFKTTNLERIQ